MPKTASSKPEMKLPKRGWARRSRNWYCQEALLGHPVLWTPEEAFAAITTWTTDPTLEREAIWPRTKRNISLGDNIRILVALSDTSTMPRCAPFFRAGLATEIVEGPASLMRVRILAYAQL